MTETTTGTAEVSTPADDTILITREFNAPRHLVWRAYTTPELVRRWWAGNSGTMTIVEIDLRIGGKWRYVLEAGPGFEVGFHGEYTRIEEPEVLVHTEIFEGLPDPDDHVGMITVTFTEKDGRTSMEMLCVYQDQADRDAVIASGMEGGMQSQMDQLEELAVSLA